MVGPKMQEFCPRINMLKEIFFKQSCNEFIKKCQNRTFKVNFNVENQLIFSKKKIHYMDRALGILNSLKAKIRSNWIIGRIKGQ